MNLKTITTNLILIILFANCLYSQTLITEKEIKLDREIDKFIIDDFENIFGINTLRNEIIKFSKDGKVLKSAGGYGWDEGLFDKPSSIYANPIEVIVSDYNNNRIQKFDKNLNYISKFETKFPYDNNFKLETPISIDVSSLGDLYVLDQKNKKVFKITGFSNIESTFGGYSSGNIYFENPKKLVVDENQRIYIMDGSGIKIFDQFTNAIKSLDIGDKEINDICISENGIYFLIGEKLFKFNKEVSEIKFLENVEQNILSFYIKYGKVYVLMEGCLKVMKEIE